MRFLSLQNHDPEEELGLGFTSNKRQTANENLETEKYAIRNLEERQRKEIEEDQREARQEGISDRFRGRKGDILERGIGFVWPPRSFHHTQTKMRRKHFYRRRWVGGWVDVWERCVSQFVPPASPSDVRSNG